MHTIANQAIEVMMAAPLNPGNGGGGSTSTAAYIGFGVFCAIVVVVMLIRRSRGQK